MRRDGLCSAAAKSVHDLLLHPRGVGGVGGLSDGRIDETCILRDRFVDSVIDLMVGGGGGGGGGLLVGTVSKARRALSDGYLSTVPYS